MSTKAERNELEMRLMQSVEQVEKEMEDIKEVAIAVEEMASDDYSKTDDCHGAVAEKLEESSEKLEQIAELINNHVEEIETALGDIHYAFNNF